MKVLIDGWNMTDKISGAQRYGYEILKELDKIVPHGEYAIIMRPEYSSVFKFRNIAIIEYRAKGSATRYIELYGYILKNNAVHVDFWNGFSIGRKSIVTRHDMFSFYNVMNVGWKGIIKSRLRAFQSALLAKKIVTVSEYSKSEIMKFTHISSDRIDIIPNGWQHVINTDEDDGVIDRFDLVDENYYLFVGRLVRNKNIDWIFNVADINPADRFVIAGAVKEYEEFKPYKGLQNNIVYTGYVSDEEMTSLYKHCKAFLFPSLMEGFGIPPMEALYYGRPIIISDIPVLKEVYENAAHYIDPYRYDYDLDEILKDSTDGPHKILKKYSWNKTASMWYELIENVAGSYK